LIQAKFVEDINLKKRPLIDILLNGFSVLIFTGALQFIVYPTLGQNLSSKDFGLVLFLMGIANLFGVTFGNTLNNLFLRYAKKSEENEGYFLFSYLVTFFFFINIGSYHSICYEHQNVSDNSNFSCSKLGSI